MADNSPDETNPPYRSGIRAGSVRDGIVRSFILESVEVNGVEAVAVDDDSVVQQAARSTGKAARLYQMARQRRNPYIEIAQGDTVPDLGPRPGKTGTDSARTFGAEPAFPGLLERGRPSRWSRRSSATRSAPRRLPRDSATSWSGWRVPACR